MSSNFPQLGFCLTGTGLSFVDFAADGWGQRDVVAVMASWELVLVGCRWHTISLEMTGFCDTSVITLVINLRVGIAIEVMEGIGGMVCEYGEEADGITEGITEMLVIFAGDGSFE